MDKSNAYIWNEKDFPGFSNFLKDLHYKSKKNFLTNTVKNSKYNKKEIDQELKMIDTFMRDFEYHYASMLKMGFVTKSNYDNILKRFKELSLVVIMPKEKRNLYGLTYRGQISINPDLGANHGFSEEAFKQLCISHELGHIINKAWLDDSRTFSKKLYDDPRVRILLKNMGLDDPKYIEFGFSLLDEVVVQEVAERVAYRKDNKPRPSKEYRTDKRIFNHNPYLTNYALYGELQEFAINFGRSLTFLGVTNSDTDEDVLLKLARASFNNDFIKRVRREMLTNLESLDNFVIMLACMGKIKASTYQILGLDNSNKNLDVTSYKDSFLKTAEAVKGR